MEAIDCQLKIEKFCPVGQSGEWYHTDSEHNAADIATRLDSTIDDLSEGSEWQIGKSYLYLPPSEWPVNRKLAERKEEHIPKGELLKRYRNLLHKTHLEPHLGIHTLIDINRTMWGKH